MSISYIFITPFVILPFMIFITRIPELFTIGFSWKAIGAIVFAAPFFAFACYVGGVGLLSTIRDLLAKRFAVRTRVEIGNVSITSLANDPRHPQNQYGGYILQHCRELDLIADQLGVTPLYELGIRQPQNESVWFPNEQGKRTVDAILEFIQRDDRFLDREGIEKDLTMMRRRLEQGEVFRLVIE